MDEYQELERSENAKTNEYFLRFCRHGIFFKGQKSEVFDCYL